MASGAIIIVECHVFTGFLMPVNLGIISIYLYLAIFGLMGFFLKPVDFYLDFF